MNIILSIEGGYEEIAGEHFIATYTSIINRDGKEFIGKSEGLAISKQMFEWVRQEKSLNKLIEAIM